MLTDLDLADDIVLLSNNASQAQDLLMSVEEKCNQVRLLVNKHKAKVTNAPTFCTPATDAK